MNYAVRQKKLAAELRCAGLDAQLITHLPNIQYLCGFTGTSGALLILAGKRGTFWSDGRYTQQAAQQVQGVRIAISKQPAWLAACRQAAKVKISCLGFEADRISYKTHREIGQLLRGKTRLKALTGLTERLRETKDSDEVEQIRAAALLGVSLLPTALSAIQPGITESAIASELEAHARRAGAEKMSFDTIISAGPRSALPHGRASNQAVPGSGFIILDYGVILAGYCSDMTRTVHMGRVSAARRRMYETVREAQLAAIAAVRPGVEAGAVDGAARLVLKKAGYGRYFTHSTGHGVGMEVHEAPQLAQGQTQKLAAGMVVTIEPGIYIPEEGGVRIEDMVLVTESGHEVLTPAAKDLVEL